jgi:transposase-like protein
MYDSLMRNKTQIGGNGIIVEIDEAKFGRRKYNRGRLITGQWVFGGVERQTKKMFVIPVPSRKAEVLLPLIKDHIAPGSVIHSDCWKAYQQINKSIYQHHVVNHSKNFVDPDTGTHTQNIERLWRDIRGSIPRYGRREEHFNHYLAEFYFKRRFDVDKRLHAFFEIMAIKYPICENINE